MPEVKETTQSNVLRMIFLTQGGSSVTWNLADPDNPSKADVTAWMQTAISNNIIDKNGLYATEVKDAYLYETIKTDLE